MLQHFYIYSVVLFLLAAHTATVRAAVDHPLVSSYNGARLLTTESVHYTELSIPLKSRDGNEPLQTRTVIGKFTVHGYELKAGTSVLAVAENYRKAVQDLGGKILLDCNQKNCGSRFVTDLLRDTWAQRASSHIDIYNLGPQSTYTYLIAQAGDRDNPVYLQWLINLSFSKTVEVQQLIAEPEELKLGNVKVDPGLLNQPLAVADLGVATGSDILGSSDHPLLSRYSGSVIRGYTTHDYDDVLVPIGPANGGAPKHLKLEGKATTIVYQAPARQSSLQILRNYEMALQQAGFDIVFSCALKECGAHHLHYLWKGHANYRRFNPMDIANIGEQADYRMLTAKLEGQARTAYAMVAIDGKSGGALYSVDVVEIAPMATNRVTIDGEFLNSAISLRGRVVLYGLNFAFNEATLLPTSDPALTVIAAYLQENPAQRFYVVGHTDSVGDYDFNLALSQRRAESVAAELRKRGIPRHRLSALGVGPVSPVSSNSHDQGQSENRRVELVLM